MRRVLAWPGGLDEYSMLFPEVASGWCDYRSFTDHNFAVLLQRLTDVVFAYEVGRFFNRFLTLR